MTGIIPDIAREIIARSGLHIELIDTPTRAAYREWIESGRADICFDFEYSYQAAEALGYKLTDPYLNAALCRLTQRNPISASSLALMRGSDISARYASEYAHIYKEIIYYDTQEALIAALSQGKHAAACLYQRSAEMAARADITNRLITQTLTGYDSPFAVAVNAALNPLAYSILYKSVASIDSEWIESIDLAYTGEANEPFSLQSYLYDYPLFFTVGVVSFFLIIGLIITALYSARARRRNKAKLVEEERQNKLLTSALDVAESAGAAKSQFLSRVSHEMRTPLNAIIGLMELRKGAPPAQADDYMENAEAAAKQLLSVINDVLDMSAIEAGKLKLSQTAFHVTQLIHTLAGIFTLQCRQKGLSFNAETLTPISEWLVGDPLRVNQILNNLLGNAVKFTRSGGITLRVRQTASVNNQCFLHFEVADTGCGMSDEMQTRLFRPFEQESGETARKYGGSGLGLSIVKNLVTMMNGAIRVESRQGVGTTFYVDLPFEKSRIGTDIRLSDETTALHVLSVDNLENERSYMSSILNRMDIRSTCVSTSEEALSELARAKEAGDAYNLCLIDWKMPDMEGEETTRRIRSLYGEHIVLIAVSSDAHSQADDRAKAAGANLFLSKPLIQSTLYDLFMTITGGHISRQSSADTSALEGRRVLLAEDNAINRVVAEGLLEKLGVITDSAEDGRIAVDRFMASPHAYYDAILMDIQMPNMDGFEATRLIRDSARPDAKTVPIIALTANAFNEDIAKSLSNGMNAHIGKPIDYQLLVETLLSAISARRA